MARVHSESTTPEIVLRRALWHSGFRYRINDKRLPGSPDIVLPKYNTALFVHGCFWHGHDKCPRFSIPKTNTDYWSAKIARNKQRDQIVWRQLEAKGWSVIIVWECQLKKTLFENTFGQIKEEIIHNGELFRYRMDLRREVRKTYCAQRSAMRKKAAAVIEELKNR